jgi:arsenite oxidase small subunit
MKRCDRKVDIGRRWFLSGAGVAAAGAAAATVISNRAEASPQLARLSYPSNRLANIGTQTQRAITSGLSGCRRARRPPQAW